MINTKKQSHDCRTNLQCGYLFSKLLGYMASYCDKVQGDVMKWALLGLLTQCVFNFLGVIARNRYLNIAVLECNF